jgi:hypothetical protein
MSQTKLIELPGDARTVAAPPAGQSRVGRPSTEPQTFDETPVGRFLARTFRVFASLQLAIVLLSLFTLCLAMATFLESAYSTRIAQFLVYRSWWFSLLLGLLAANILCAALKKMDLQKLARRSWPWKKHQTGFLITHAGLLTLVFGGLLTAWGGTDGQMILIDTPNREIQQWSRLPNKSSRILLSDQQRIEVYHIPRAAFHETQLLHEIIGAIEDPAAMTGEVEKALEGHSWNFPFNPGPFAWHADDRFSPDLPWTLKLLHTLADPLPGLTRDLDGQATLAVQNYFPHTEYWPYSAAAGRDKGFPALKLRLTTPMTGKPFDRWVTGMPTLEREASPMAMEMMLLPDPALLPEFLDPPRKMGPDGQLVLFLAKTSRPLRIPVDRKKLAKHVRLPGTGLKLSITKCSDLLEMVGRKNAAGGKALAPEYHAVRFELSGPQGKGEYLACARFPNLPPFQKGSDAGPLAVWYHHPDFRWGNPQLMGSVQFAHTPDGKIFYRAWGRDGLRQKGTPLDVDDTERVHRLPWQPMQMRFQVAGFLPRAVAREGFLPRQVRPGAETSDKLDPGLRCTLTVGQHTEEFSLRLSRRAVQVRVGQEIFFVRYHMDDQPVDFALTLKHAQQLSDPGTSRAASFQSDVVLTYEKDGKQVNEDHTISMNNTLDYGQYKVYQANYRPLTDPDTLRLVLDTRGKLVSLSGLTVSHDPGLYFKYAGSCLLVLGIAVMFYMKAYFFKR